MSLDLLNSEKFLNAIKTPEQLQSRISSNPIISFAYPLHGVCIYSDFELITNNNESNNNNLPPSVFDSKYFTVVLKYSYSLPNKSNPVSIEFSLCKLGLDTVVLNILLINEDKSENLSTHVYNIKSYLNLSETLANNNNEIGIPSNLPFHSKEKLSELAQSLNHNIKTHLNSYLPSSSSADTGTSLGPGFYTDPGGPSLNPNVPKAAMTTEQAASLGYLPPEPNLPSVGRSDVEPMGGDFGTIGGGRLPSGINPSSSGGNDGMFVGPNHPLFTGNHQPQQGSSSLLEEQGIPDPLHPPGARWDPVGPGMDPNFPPARGRGRGRPRGSRGRGRGFGDEFPPPGFDNSFGHGPFGGGGPGPGSMFG